jgi:hypothetical protein
MRKMISRVRSWLNQIVVVKRWALAITLAVMVMLVGAFYYQTQAIQHNQRQAECVARVEVRDDLRSVLFKVVDLSDLFTAGGKKPSAGVIAYTRNRVDFINEKYPALPISKCKNA